MAAERSWHPAGEEGPGSNAIGRAPGGSFLKATVFIGIALLLGTIKFSKLFLPLKEKISITHIKENAD